MESERKKLKISHSNDHQSVNDFEDSSGSPDLGAFATSFLDIEDKQCGALLQLDYGMNICYVYNPLDYAREIHRDFLAKFCKGPKKVLLLGMNPGPWGMGQTGVPFGHVQYAKDWLRVKGSVTKPENEHPKRLITGLECRRSEVKERSGLEAICNAALVDTVKLLGIEHLVCVGNYTTEKSKLALERAGLESIKISTLMHPSPVNPAANKGWREIAIRQLTESGVIHYFKAPEKSSWN
ncbi:single-strand selective monofunctional uracil DNA glycosylase isoform X2 [Palaemon carinicauda]|uniref:single-strand selective monofunctional uracil DNA glycosylase isoform X2 n=1 Tax=Palaemon carinicauda TaxID=392227 RepID=UPI0035B6AAFE